MSPDARRRSRPSLGSAVELRLREIRRCQPQEGGHQRNAQWQKISARGPRDQLWMAAGKTSRPSTLPKFSVTASAERRKADRPETGGSTVLPEAGTRKGGRRWPPSDGTAVTSE